MYELREPKDVPSDFLDDLCTYNDDYLGCCASTTDCTGLIPAGMVTEAELLAYKDVYAFPPPVAVTEKDIYHFDSKTSVPNLK